MKKVGNLEKTFFEMILVDRASKLVSNIEKVIISNILGEIEVPV